MHMGRTEGMRGMFKGNWTNCVRIIPNSAMKFFTYEQLSRWGPQLGVSSGGREGAAAAAARMHWHAFAAGRSGPSNATLHAATPAHTCTCARMQCIACLQCIAFCQHSHS